MAAIGGDCMYEGGKPSFGMHAQLAAVPYCALSVHRGARGVLDPGGCLSVQLRQHPAPPSLKHPHRPHPLGAPCIARPEKTDNALVGE